MKPKQFSEVTVGQRFKFAPETEAVLVRVEPRPHSYEHERPCPSCGEPKQTWVNAEVIDTGSGRHVCPDRLVHLLDDGAPSPNASMDVERIRRKVEEILRQKNLSYEVKQDGQLWVRQGSTLVGVSVSQWQNRTLVLLSAPLALHAKNITPEFAHSLLLKSGQAMLGGYFIGREGDSIWYGHTLFGESLQADDLLLSLVIVGMTADQNDDEITKLVRGQRAIDVLSGKATSA
jgi:hypothetical protein